MQPRFVIKNMLRNLNRINKMVGLMECLNSVATKQNEGKEDSNTLVREVKLNEEREFTPYVTGEENHWEQHGK